MFHEKEKHLIVVHSVQASGVEESSIQLGFVDGWVPHSDESPFKVLCSSLALNH
jgi:hypothetical protein